MSAAGASMGSPAAWLRIDFDDTATIRGSRGFSPGVSAVDGESLRFPPPASTVLGGLRAALARALAWTGHGLWDAELMAQLGDGPEHLGPLRFRGPFLGRRYDQAPGGLELLFPLPATVLGAAQGGKAWRAGAVLAPQAVPEGCLVFDGVTLHEGGDPASGGLFPRLLAPEPAGPLWSPPPSRSWVTAAGLGAVLAGRLPEAQSVVPQAELFAVEVHTQVQRDLATFSVVEDGGLYATVHARLKPGVCVVLQASGLPDGVQFPLHGRFGGEGRLASVSVLMPAPAGADRLDAQARGSLPEGGVAIAITPVRAEDATAAGLDGAAAALVSTEFIGGWDGRPGRVGPTPLLPHHPAGSAWFGPCSLPARRPDGLNDFVVSRL